MASRGNWRPATRRPCGVTLLPFTQPILTTRNTESLLWAITCSPPVANPTNNTPIEVHPGWVASGRDDAPGRKAYYINLEAKPGKGEQVQSLLRNILAGVEQEPGTGPWFGARFSDTTFGALEALPFSGARPF